jgi:hypothetical protein
VISKKSTKTKKAGMLELCSRRNQDAGAMLAQGEMRQAVLNARQLISLNIQDRITVASENHIYG